MKPHEDDGLRARATLPVFALTKDPAPDEAVRSLAASVIAPSPTVDVEPVPSSIWIANDALWRLPAITPSSIDALPKTLPGNRSDDLAPVVRSLEQRTNGIRVRADPAWSDGARLVIWERTGWTRTHRFLDRTDGYTLSLDAPDHDLDGVPLTGPGAVVTTRTGPRGEPFAIHAAVPRPTGARLELPIVDRATADETVREGLRAFDCVRLDATLTYRVVETPVDGISARTGPTMSSHVTRTGTCRLRVGACRQSKSSYCPRPPLRSLPTLRTTISSPDGEAPRQNLAFSCPGWARRQDRSR